MTKNRVPILIVAIAAFLLPGFAFAGASATDWTLGPGGLYTYAGGNSALVGTNIPIVGVLGSSTPLNDGASFSVANGLLNFTTGSGTSGAWSWASGGTLNVTGCIAGITAAACDGTNNVVLISDDFTSVSVSATVPGFMDVVFGGVTGTINSSVANYYGVTEAFSVGTFSAVMSSSAVQFGNITGSSLGGVIIADPPPPSASMPEYWGAADSLGLLAFMIIACAVLVRRGTLKSRLVQV